MAETTAPAGAEQGGEPADRLTAPFREAIFRRIWFASLFSNFGALIQGVGAAWSMTELTGRADLVALVQSAQMAPFMVLSLASGAIADMYDRRKVALIGLGFCLFSSACLTIIAMAGGLSPAVLLIFTFTIGLGVAIFAPSWAASVREQVNPRLLPQAIALNSISFNIARSFGPALGGVIVAGAGAGAAFGLNTLFYLPLIYVLWKWNRVETPSRLPPERLGWAVVSGVRFVWHAPSIRKAVIRTFLTTGCGGCILALMPLVARENLQGEAETFGLMLGAFGVGAIAAAFSAGEIRRRMSAETCARVFSVTLGLSMAVIGASHSALFTAPALIAAGASWMSLITVFNVSVQTSAPRWVSGRALATFQAANAAGNALGAWCWGLVAGAWGLTPALLIAGGLMTLLPVVGLWLTLDPITGRDGDALEAPADPDIRLGVTGRSGPISIDVEYRIDIERAREFYRTMQAVRQLRQRNGAYGWSLSRDLADPELWVERYSSPTWHDYLRLRARTTEEDAEAHRAALAFHVGDAPPIVHRRLERPLGSVRWTDDVPEGAETVPVMPGTSGSV
ncbi:MFS transporter [Phenylobacterium immobile]|uniref:MFS transporter n=1 Tax=Phenylobacterium immobile TaxID=21 RepID=UPI000AEC48C1|nr:MFS transporter [Phenylobacterium immobile]